MIRGNMMKSQSMGAHYVTYQAAEQDEDVELMGPKCNVAVEIRVLLN